MKNLTPEDMVVWEEGVVAELAVNSPAIASAINEISEELANAILATRIDDMAKREYLYRLHVALREITAKLKQRIDAKKNIEFQQELADQENE